MGSSLNGLHFMLELLIYCTVCTVCTVLCYAPLLDEVHIFLGAFCYFKLNGLFGIVHRDVFFLHFDPTATDQGVKLV